MAKIDDQKIADILGYQFSNPSLLHQALTHSSLTHKPHNERLEFIGDGILGAIIGYYLYQNYPNYDEGQLTYCRAFLVNKRCLAKLANQMNLVKYIQFHHSFEQKKLSDRIAASALEAILGAVFVDGEYPACYELVIRIFEKELKALKTKQTIVKDSKTALQELCQKKGLDLPQYELLEKTGPDHLWVFVVQCVCANHQAQGQARSMRIAQQRAAQAILRRIEKDV